MKNVLGSWIGVSTIFHGTVQSVLNRENIPRTDPRKRVACIVDVWNEGEWVVQHTWIAIPRSLKLEVGDSVSFRARSYTYLKGSGYWGRRVCYGLWPMGNWEVRRTGGSSPPPQIKVPVGEGFENDLEQADEAL